MSTLIKFFNDTLHSLDSAISGAINLIIPAIALLAAGYLREQLLRAKVRSAALEAELKGEDGDDDDSFVSKLDVPSILAASQSKLKKMVPHERSHARKLSQVYRESQEAPLPPEQPPASGVESHEPPAKS